MLIVHYNYVLNHEEYANYRPYLRQYLPYFNVSHLHLRSNWIKSEEETEVSIILK